jgi:uncharacterized heparinase superfamily protein
LTPGNRPSPTIAISKRADLLVPYCFRYVHTLRYYRPGQILARVAKRLRRPLAGLVWRACRHGPGLPVRNLTTVFPSLVPPGSKLSLSSDEFCLTLLGHEIKAGRFDWASLDREAPTRLWRFQLHYHEFLENLLREQPSAQAAEHLWSLIAAWIDLYDTSSAARGDPCHPYVVSRRIPVWVKLFLRHPPRGPLAERVLSLLAAQARWLHRNLEFDLGGNHLLQNLRGLAVAAVLFDGPEPRRWLATVWRHLRRELLEQILPHGEHFERSPAYHVDMLLALADIQMAARSAGGTWAAALDEPLSKMATFLREILHPDGQIPLFGDSTFHQIPHPQVVLQELGFPYQVPRPGRATSKIIGDYWVFREANNYVIFDGGPVGPDHLPAHAHADLLTLEASWSGRRLIVDAGVFDYEDSPERAYCRSTAAHNTLEIDGENQCDVWSRFRMGRRGWPGKLLAGVDGAFHWAHCTHNAYRHLGVREVKRVVVVSEQGGIVILDFAKGRGRHLLCSRIRIDGSWVVTQEGASFVRVQNGSAVLKITTVGRDLPIKIKRADYYPLFGQRSFAWELSITLETDLPAAAGWLIMPVAAGDVKLDWEEGAVLVVRDGCAHRVRIPGL